VFYEGIEWAGESALVPTYVVSLSGCNLRCDFCLTGRQSQDGTAGMPLDADAVAARIRGSASTLRSVTILGGEPAVHLDGALELAARVPPGLRLVWKTAAYASPEGLAFLRGIPDVVLADYKFGNDACAERLAGVPNYTAVVRRNLLWAARNGRLIVRHLLMPGHADCCFEPIARWLARRLPRIPLSLMSGFLPVFRSESHPELTRTNRPSEAALARRFAPSLGLHLASWRMAPPQVGTSLSSDEIWIDRTGRICVDSASPELISMLRSVSKGMRMESAL
jgi:putative pyruvate formate lyase activating enzyme